jgi:hypothetical protein
MLSPEEDLSPLEVACQSLHAAWDVLYVPSTFSDYSSYNSMVNMAWEFHEVLFQTLYNFAASGWLATSLDSGSSPVLLSHMLATLCSVLAHLDSSVQYLGTNASLEYQSGTDFYPNIGMSLPCTFMDFSGPTAFAHHFSNDYLYEAPPPPIVPRHSCHHGFHACREPLSSSTGFTSKVMIEDD